MGQRLHVVITLLTVSLMMGIGSLLIHNSASADHKPIVEAIYQYDRFVEEEKYENAKALLTDHKVAISQLFEKDAPTLKEELVSLLETNIAVINDQTFSAEYKRAQALSLLLVVDSLDNPKDPIWHKWKTDIEQSLSSLISSEQANKNQIKTLISEWNIMEPALKLSLDKDNYHQLAASFRALEMKEGSNKKELEAVFNHMQTIQLNDALNNKDTINFVWMICIVGGFITLTLSYVAWKKYKGEKFSQKQMVN